MSTAFYRTVIPASCIMITRMVNTISKFLISQPSTSLTLRRTPKLLMPSPPDSSKGKAAIGSLYLKSLLPGLHRDITWSFHPAMKLSEELRDTMSSTHPSSVAYDPATTALSYGSLYLSSFRRSRLPSLHRDIIWGFHPAMKLFEKQRKASSTAIESSSPTTVSVTAPSDGALTITVPEGTKQSMIDNYRQMESQLESLQSENALSTITKLSLSVPYKLAPQHSPSSVPTGSESTTMIPTPNLRKFEWHGKLENLPAPWYRLAQFDFSELETLVLRNCKISVEDCLFILQKAPTLKRFAVHAISDVPSTTKCPQGNDLSFPALQHLVVACGDVDLSSFWEVIGKSCKKLDTLILSPGTNYTENNIKSIPWDLGTLRSVNIKNVPKVLEESVTRKQARYQTTVSITADYQ